MSKLNQPTYAFETSDAIKYGVDEAIFLYNIRFWLRTNAAKKSHIKEGRVWTWNTVEAFAVLFPFWTSRKIRTIISNLEKNGILMSAVYNFNKSNRTKWYSINEDDYMVASKEVNTDAMDLQQYTDWLNSQEEDAFDKKLSLEVK